MKVVTVLGTRPEIIKLSPLIPLLDAEFEQVLVHTGQHYSWEMDQMFFQELQVREPDYNLNVGSGRHGEQTGKIMLELEIVLLKEKPDLLIVLGDTNSTLAAAVVGSKLGCKVVHLEAGCRSRNRYQPEEINRIVADHCADILFTIDTESTDNLLKEGLKQEQIFYVGNIVEEACFRAITLSNVSKNVFVEVSDDEVSERKGNILVTIHRAENTDNPARLRNIVEALNILSEKASVVFPIHPRTKKVLSENKIRLSAKVKVLEPQGYAAFVSLLSKCSVVITDSGGVLEEATFLNVPALIPREKTELHELIDQGKAFLVGTNTGDLVKAAEEQLSRKIVKTELQNPAISSKIVDILKRCKV